MPAQGNIQVFLAARPQGMPRETDFGVRAAAVPEPGADEVVVRTEYVSVDPYMRGHIDGVYSQIRPLAVGDTMFAGAVGRVVRSRSRDIAEGEIVEGYLGWQLFSAAPAAELRKVDPALAPVSTALGVLGMPGMTAYFGMTEIARPKPGETVVVSAAAGAVGSAAGQIARILGSRVVGMVGSQAKADHVTESLGFDGAVDYRQAADLHQALAAACPKRIDVYFDNVGGPTYDAVTRWMNVGCRYVVCGQIAQYNDTAADSGPRNLKQFETCRARLEGLRVLDYRSRYAEGIAHMAAWLREGRLRYRETVVDGIENAPRAFIGMLKGANIGKQLVRVAGGAG